MPSRLGIRFALEALFLLAVAVAVGFAHLAAKWIVLVMVGAWLLASLVELAAAQPRVPAFLKGWRRYFKRPARPAPAAAGPEGAAPAKPTAAPAAKPRFWRRFMRTRPAPVQSAAAPAEAVAPPVEPAPEPLTTPAEEPAPAPPPPRPERQPEREPELEPQPTPEPAAAAPAAETPGQTERRSKYTLEPLQPRARKFVMPWQRRAERIRLGLEEPPAPKPAKQKKPNEPKQRKEKPAKPKGRRRGLFASGKKQSGEKKSSDGP